MQVQRGSRCQAVSPFQSGMNLLLFVLLVLALCCLAAATPTQCQTPAWTPSLTASVKEKLTELSQEDVWAALEDPEFTDAVFQALAASDSLQAGHVQIEEEGDVLHKLSAAALENKSIVSVLQTREAELRRKVKDMMEDTEYLQKRDDVIPGRNRADTLNQCLPIALLWVFPQMAKCNISFRSLQEPRKLPWENTQDSR